MILFLDLQTNPIKRVKIATFEEWLIMMPTAIRGVTVSGFNVLEV